MFGFYLMIFFYLILQLLFFNFNRQFQCRNLKLPVSDQVSKKNLMEIVKKLMVHMERAEGTLYRDELLTRMIEICAQNNYQHVVDFEWYVTVLAELTEMETSAKHGTGPGHLRHTRCRGRT